MAWECLSLPWAIILLVPHSDALINYVQGGGGGGGGGESLPVWSVSVRFFFLIHFF